VHRLLADFQNAGLIDTTEQDCVEEFEEVEEENNDDPEE
jgi:hypothetical protein